ncbi:XF1762 family protein [Enterococcus avium]|uniref:XF1762 family protein n=1 Tax=Enterococcus avium TaxID=33945 RepID=UPI0035140260
MRLIAKFMPQREAKEYIKENHRHHKPPQGDIFRVAALENEKIVGVVMVGRPVSRMLDDGFTCEVTRLCTDGTTNACSFLYSRAARIAKEMGFKKIITYILETEPGTSLKASGWTNEGEAGGGSWDKPSRKRTDKAPTCKKQRWSKLL